MSARGGCAGLASRSAAQAEGEEPEAAAAVPRPPGALGPRSPHPLSGGRRREEEKEEGASLPPPPGPQRRSAAATSLRGSSPLHGPAAAPAVVRAAPRRAGAALGQRERSRPRGPRGADEWRSAAARLPLPEDPDAGHRGPSSSRSSGRAGGRRRARAALVPAPRPRRPRRGGRPQRKALQSLLASPPRSSFLSTEGLAGPEEGGGEARAGH